MVETGGFLNLNKPVGPTSFDMVRLVKRVTGIRRVGHGGTLDPLAGGVLPICLGQATRMMEHVIAGRKEYRARVRLGVSTDTYDAGGRVTSLRDASHISLGDVSHELPRFKGRVDQVPPMFSALKLGGRPLYSLARQGVEIDRIPRTVAIYGLELSEWEPPDFTLTVKCGRGTYIRSLAHDLGESLGCGAHVAALTRTGVGPFVIGEAVTPDGLVEAAEAGYWQALLLPMDLPVLRTPATILDHESEKALLEGRFLRDRRAEPDRYKPGQEELCRAYSPDGRLLALVVYDGALPGWKPVKVFPR